MILRPFTVNDIDELLKLIRHPDVTRYIPNLVKDKEALISWLKNRPSTDHEYLILLGKQVIGECSLDENSGEIGIMLYPEYWRQGYGTAAIKHLMQIAVNLGINEVYAQTDRRNDACIGLFESLSFIHCGIGWTLWEDNLETSPNKFQEIVILKKKLEIESKYISNHV